MSTINKIIFFTLIGTTLLACERDDDSPVVMSQVTIEGQVLHHDTPIPNARIFLKYGAIEFPGQDTSVYDYGISADTMAHFEINNIDVGKYYLYGLGYDSSIHDSVFGGVPVDLKGNSSVREINVPVTE